MRLLVRSMDFSMEVWILVWKYGFLYRSMDFCIEVWILVWKYGFLWISLDFGWNLLSFV